MYTVAVKKLFNADHFLPGAADEAERRRHTHHYGVEAEFSGGTLDTRGYLIDIAEVEQHLNEIIARYAGQLLNEQPDFFALNPSIEHFARIFTRELMEKVDIEFLSSIKVTIAENEYARASFEQRNDL